MTIRVTPARGIRYPGLEELGRPSALQYTAEDFDTAFTKSDSLRSAAEHKPRARVWRAAGSQNITKATWTQLTGFDTELYDSDNLGNLGTNNDRLTVNTPGLYLFAAYAQGNTGGVAMGSGRLAIARNAATIGSADFIHKAGYVAVAASTYLFSCWAVYLMAATDNARLWVYWNGTPAGPAPFSSYSLTATLLCTNP